MSAFPTASAILVAAGESSRFGGTSKPFQSLLGRPMVAWSLDAAQSCPLVKEIVLVVNEKDRQLATELHQSAAWSKLQAPVIGGSHRHESVRNGFAVLESSCEIVAIHDAARPLVTAELFTDTISVAERAGAAIAATPVVDTLKSVKHGFVERTVPRDNLWSAQTPQAFRVSIVRGCFDSPHYPGQFTDEAALLEMSGFPVEIVLSSRENLKVTYQQDLPVAEAILKQRAQEVSSTK